MSNVSRSLRGSADTLASAVANPGFVRSVERGAETLVEALRNGGKILAFGNGGSAADAQHLAAELVGRFRRPRHGLPALALTTDSSALTSIGNDFGFDQVFARQLEALGSSGDVALAISTSGGSPNVLAGVEAARRLGLTIIGLTGGNGGKLARTADLAIIAPSDVTARIQECHAAVVHALCEAVDAAFAEE